MDVTILRRKVKDDENNSDKNNERSNMMSMNEQYGGMKRYDEHEK